VAIGPRFSNTMLQAMLVLLKKSPPTEGRKLLIIGTTSAPHLLEQMSFRTAFNVVLTVPQVRTGDEVRTVFESMQVPIEARELDAICARTAAAGAVDEGEGNGGETEKCQADRHRGRQGSARPRPQ
jgi:vesicle-fusing ATPase